MPFVVQPRLLACLVASACVSMHAAAETPAPLPEITIKATGIEADTTTSAPGAPTDVADNLSRVPGMGVVRNGGQTGIVQMRGLFNERVRLRVDGMEITPACPNHMDPPLHYAGQESLDDLEVLVGATPVSKGGDSLTGSVEAKSRAPEFNADATWATGGRLSGGYDSVRDGQAYEAELNTRNDQVHLRYTGGHSTANDYESARGRVADTSYTNTRHSLLAAFNTTPGIFQLEFGVHDAHDVGTPVLPMDMISDDAKRVRFAFEGSNALGKLLVSAYRHDIEHLMDNFTLRPAGAQRMEAPSTSLDHGLAVALAHPLATGGTLNVGAEFRTNDFEAFQRNVGTGARQDMFNDSSRDRYGIYGEWDGQLSPALHLNAGLRGDFVRMDSGNIVQTFAPSVGDRTSFNAADHRIDDNNVDATLSTRYTLSETVTLEGALTRKTRSPSVVERFLYTPLAASAGQADGRTYLGSLALDPEVAHAINLGFSTQVGGLKFKASTFYQDITDFIQGQAIARLDTNGRAVLQYANVDASLWGAETSANMSLGDVALAAWVSFSRGTYETPAGAEDNLYRIAPLRGGVSADWQAETWSVGAEWILSARKDKVAAYNGELPTPGYGILNLRARYDIARNLELTAGIDNVFDKIYYDPLASVNRVAGGAVAVGGIMPGTGRAGHAKLNWRF